MTRRHRIIGLSSAIALCALMAACISYKQPAQVKADRGVKFSHALHAEQELECAICHEPDGAAYTFPTHDQCSVCHDINMDDPKPEACGFCHTNEAFELVEWKRPFGEDIKFNHEPHIAKELDCKTCHGNLDAGTLSGGPQKPFCMDCHGKTDPKLNECSVCHVAMNTQAVPSSRAGVHIAHGEPAAWKRVHGAESKVDPKFCALCHSDQSFCDDCHTTTAPDSHTASWRRKTHGMQASFDRNNCSVCHEEDSCLKCHSNTEPESHRQAWGPPANHHCTTCHYPPSKTNCVVCHESIEHPSALPSPHRVLLYPAQCAQCHPGGQTTRAPHPMNSTVNCRFCH